MANPQRRSVVERLTEKSKEMVNAGMEQALQYGKDVATGKKLMEGLSQNDGAFQGWLAHGSTELANMLLHGHPAPVYARSLSPADTEGQSSAEPQQETAQEVAAPSRQNETGVHGPQKDPASQHQFRSSVGQLCQECEATRDAPEMQRQMSH